MRFLAVSSQPMSPRSRTSSVEKGSIDMCGRLGFTLGTKAKSSSFFVCSSTACGIGRSSLAASARNAVCGPAGKESSAWSTLHRRRTPSEPRFTLKVSIKRGSWTRSMVGSLAPIARGSDLVQARTWERCSRREMLRAKDCKGVPSRAYNKFKRYSGSLFSSLVKRFRMMAHQPRY